MVLTCTWVHSSLCFALRILLSSSLPPPSSLPPMGRVRSGRAVPCRARPAKSHPQVARPAPSGRFRPGLETPPHPVSHQAARVARGPPCPPDLTWEGRPGPGRRAGGPAGALRAPLSEIFLGIAEETDRRLGRRTTGAHNVRADRLQLDDSDTCPGMVSPSRSLVLPAELFSDARAQPRRCAARGCSNGLMRAATARLRLIICIDSETFKFGARVPEPGLGSCGVFRAVLREANPWT